MLAFEDRWHFIAIMACHSQELGGGDEFFERSLAIKLGVQLRELEEIQRRLMDVNLIDANWIPIGWDDRQFLSDNSKARVKKYREKQRLSKSVTEVKRDCNVTVTVQDTDTDTDTEQKQNKSISNQEKKIILARVAALGIDSDLWTEYLKTRKRLKATNTPRGLRTLLSRIEKFVSQGRDATAMIEEANAQGWKTVYEPKGDTNVSKSALAILNHTDW
ncbi:MAG: hypothetical protein ACO20P_15235 [bacterium]